MAIAEKQGDSTQLSNIANDLRNLYLAKENYTAALPLYLRSLAIREHIEGKSSQKVADSCYNLGILFLEQGRYTEAQAQFERTLNIRQKLFAPNSQLVADTFFQLSNVYKAENKLIDAQNALKAALTIESKNSQADQAILPSAASLALLYKENGQVDQAMQLYTHLIESGERLIAVAQPAGRGGVSRVAGAQQRLHASRLGVHRLLEQGERLVRREHIADVAIIELRRDLVRSHLRDESPYGFPARRPPYPTRH